jgi:hypothetical protein
VVCKSQVLKIDELVTLVHPRDGHRKILVMLEAYMDESGIHDEAPICIVAGYFAEHREWAKFEKKWKSVLSDHLVPLEQFHAKDFIKRTGFFRKSRWRDLAYLTFGNEVVKAIHRYKIYSVSCGIVVEDFNSFSLKERRAMTGGLDAKGQVTKTGCPGKPYFVPFQLCIERVCHYTPKEAKAHFFFGVDRSFAKYATELFAIVKSRSYDPLSNCLGMIGYPDAKDTAALQASDLLAYCSYRLLEERWKTGNWELPPPHLLLALTQRAKSKQRDFVYHNRQSLAKALEHLPPNARMALKDDERIAFHA